MLGIVPQRDKPVLDVEPAGGLINGIDLNGPDADVLGDVRGSAQSVDQKVFSHAWPWTERSTASRPSRTGMSIVGSLFA